MFKLKIVPAASLQKKGGQSQGRLWPHKRTRCLLNSLHEFFCSFLNGHLAEAYHLAEFRQNNCGNLVVAGGANIGPRGTLSA